MAYIFSGVDNTFISKWNNILLLLYSLAPKWSVIYGKNTIKLAFSQKPIVKISQATFSWYAF